MRINVSKEGHCWLLAYKRNCIGGLWALAFFFSQRGLCWTYQYHTQWERKNHNKRQDHKQKLQGNQQVLGDNTKDSVFLKLVFWETRPRNVWKGDFYSVWTFWRLQISNLSVRCRYSQRWTRCRALWRSEWWCHPHSLIQNKAAKEYIFIYHKTFPCYQNSISTNFCLFPFCYAFHVRAFLIVILISYSQEESSSIVLTMQW